jgi:glutamate dehydrogenase (NAD(P)+)
MAKVNPFAVAQQQLDQCAKILHLDAGVQAILRVPSRELHVSLPVRMDDGSVKVFQGFRVQYNDAKGPCKGGIRFHPDETIDTVRALAAWMTWKCSLLDLPLGGGKGGVICNPKEMSQGELERLCRIYIDQVGRIVGPEKDVPAPDVYTNPQMMAWMMDEYSKISGKNQFGMITGKPLAVGGSQGRPLYGPRGGKGTGDRSVKGHDRRAGIRQCRLLCGLPGPVDVRFQGRCRQRLDGLLGVRVWSRPGSRRKA